MGEDMKKKRKGWGMMLTGAVLLLAALFLAGRDMLEEQRSNLAADDVFQELSQYVPHVTASPEASVTPGLRLTDQQGRAIDWPMDPSGMLIPWPVDDAGQPVPQVTDAIGRTYAWDPLPNRPVLIEPATTPSPAATAFTIAPSTAMSPAFSPAITESPTAVSFTAPAATVPALSGSTPDATLLATEGAGPTAAVTSPAHSPSPIPSNSPAEAPTAALVQLTAPPSETPLSPSSAPQTPIITPPRRPITDVTFPVSEWNVGADGSLMPYVSDGNGVILPWMTDMFGTPLSLDTLKAMWKDLIAQLSLNLMDMLKKPAFVLNPEMEMPTVTLNDGYDYIGILDIPSQKISLSIMADWSYPQLRITPCLWVGSIYAGDAIIAGHNTARHLTAIKQLKLGDEVFFTDVDGNRFCYIVSSFETIDGNDVKRMLAGDDQWDLTLFTCSHSSTKRFTVRCRLDHYVLPEAQ